MNPLKSLQDYGQAVWLDFLSRGFTAKGGLKKLVDEDGIRGVTSNPSIFEHAIGHTDEYDDAIGRLLRERDLSAGDIFEHLAIEDIQATADVLRPVYHATRGADGFVSMEVSPYLAKDTAATIAEAKRLWSAIHRDNLMIKVPATPEGLPAIRDLIGEGINVNITLLFAQSVYEQVVEAYLAGLEKLAARGGDLKKIASVASFFVSRIDTAIDKLLDDAIARANDPDEKARLTALKGKTAIANAKLAYQRYLRLFAGERWDALQGKGAKPQRLLWASTGTKNKAYSDVLYVEELIGHNTVNTMPTPTMDAFRDHGKLRESLAENIPDAQRTLDQLDRSGISLDDVTAKLVEDGVKLFADAADKLFGAVAKKRQDILKEKVDPQQLSLGNGLAKKSEEIAEEWRANGNIRKLWARDKSLWTNADEDKWLGWLDSVSDEQIADYTAFAQSIKRDGFTDAVLLGMGGSSLGPEVLTVTFGHNKGWPRLHILDSTVPAQITAIEKDIDVTKTLFIVSSKSGGTTEPNVLADYFFKRVADKTSADKAGNHFIAVTDPSSSLEKRAKEQGFRHVFFGVPSIGGRYSVLSPFGLVPAAIAGIDVQELIAATRIMMRSCGPDVPPPENPGIALGIALGAAAARGRDKVTIFATPGVASFGAWAEQLFAESTGKHGKGLIPIDGEPIARTEIYGDDRFFIDLTLLGEADAEHEAKLAKLEKAGHPVVRIVQNAKSDIGQEFFRFEIATAIAGAVIGINPFDQPDVEASKTKTRELTSAFEKTGSLPSETPVCSDQSLALYTDKANADALRKAGANGGVESWLRAHFSRVGAGDYVAFLAYLAYGGADADKLQKLRLDLRDRQHVATCLEFGPRFLHSTGQAYKGGPDSGVFLQITSDDAADLAIPEHRASFGVVKAAQARGDFDVLAERGRRALRVHLGSDVAQGIAALTAAIERALS
ncbi:MAG TPA: bifunctional transaldolase/phosoglucose isomerase [Xanthobacteraceae bacterium]|jgi:transaldolase/glucose-6-phosphate isomerase|nr:bifunctional transaldolase/phosoglucose isomerase [Xanthobacteraceae bacterium]